MLQQAINKLQGEIEAETSKMTKMFGQQVIDIIENTKDFGQVLQDDKTLAACKKNMDKYAEEHRKGNEFCIGPKQAEKIIKEYYGIKEKKDRGAAIDILDLL